MRVQAQLYPPSGLNKELKWLHNKFISISSLIEQTFTLQGSIFVLGNALQLFTEYHKHKTTKLIDTFKGKIIPQRIIFN